MLLSTSWGTGRVSWLGSPQVVLGKLLWERLQASMVAQQRPWQRCPHHLAGPLLMALGSRTGFTASSGTRCRTGASSKQREESRRWIH